MLKALQQISDQDARSLLTGSQTVGNEAAGQLAWTSDGRAYRYAIAGAVALLPGKATVPAATTTNSVNQTGTANPVGTNVITYTVGATAITQDQFAGGFFAVNDTATTGVNVYRIKNNTPVAAGGGSITVTLAVDEPLTVATTTASKFSLYPGPFRNTVLQTAAATAAVNPAGVPNIGVPAAAGYWSQVGGYCAVLSDGIIAKGVGAIASGSVDGALVTEATGTLVIRQAYAPEATVDAKYYPLVLTLSQ